MEGVAFIDAFDPRKPEVQAFIKVYKKEHGKKPYSLPAYGYDDLMVLVQAIKRAGSTDKVKVCAALKATHNWVGVLAAKGTSYSFAKGRAGYPVEGAVVRLIKNNDHGPVVHNGTK
jgi:branched-chain amino acid transport system substrate-binding protein